MHDEGNVLLDVDFHDDPEPRRPPSTAPTLVLEETFASARLTALPMEGRACLAEWDDPRPAAHAVDVDAGAAPRPHDRRRRCCGMPEHRLRVVAPDVGGGFGQKCVVAREEALRASRRGSRAAR